MTAPYTVSLDVGGSAKTPLSLEVSLAPADPPQINFGLLASDAGGIATDDRVEVSVTDDYDSESITTIWVAYVQDKETAKNVTTVTAFGSEMWLARRVIRSKKGPADIGQIVKEYVDENGDPVTSGGVKTDTGTNAIQEADYITILQLLDEWRQQGFRSFVKRVSATNPEELQFFKESKSQKAATRELAYGV